ncbi:MAG: hypothetical protein QNK37_21965 [Acidobacteriota bacterium]|nr:hypothetical protein [Acidobacteriota bacterium]
MPTQWETLDDHTPDQIVTDLLGNDLSGAYRGQVGRSVAYLLPISRLESRLNVRGGCPPGLLLLMMPHDIDSPEDLPTPDETPEPVTLFASCQPDRLDNRPDLSASGTLNLDEGAVTVYRHAGNRAGLGNVPQSSLNQPEPDGHLKRRTGWFDKRSG